MTSRRKRIGMLVVSAVLSGCALVVGIDDLDGPSRAPSSAEPPSCAGGGPGRSTCGESKTESCCVSPPVTGGAFLRGYDGVTFTDQSAPATVSSFRLDRYKVTVGRFRPFVREVANGWRPESGAGRHTHLAGGRGLTVTGGGNEPGWDVSLNGALPPNETAWTQRLSCAPPANHTWTAAPGANEDMPITCVDWAAAYAFCIWDGGFLPTFAEANYVAAGGGGPDGQRVYPWSKPSSATAIDCTRANHGDGGVGVCPPPGVHPVGASSPSGDGAFGHSDLVGNTWIWLLDWSGGEFLTPCDDCVTTRMTEAARGLWGTSYKFTPAEQRVGSAYGRYNPNITGDPAGHELGVRCARKP